MEKFKKSMQTRVKLLGIIFAIYNIIMLYLNLNPDKFNIDTTSHLGSFSHGVRLGVSIGLSILCLFMMQKYNKTTKNNEKLKELYIEETDERKILIQRKVNSAVINTFRVLSIVALVISSYFNIVVFFTILAITMFLNFLSIILKLYYLKSI